MYPRKRLEMSWSDLMSGMGACLNTPDAAALTRALSGVWQHASPHAWHPALSVRSGFDAALQALELPAGSEVIVSAITIPHMLQLLDHHKLVAVPLDLDPDTLSLDPDALKQAISPKTRAILIAHLFGSRMDLTPIAQIARDHDLLLLEDAAQAFTAAGYLGHPMSDLVMFSFGAIKSFTALGGAMIGARDAVLARQVAAILSAHPAQAQRVYLKKLLTYSLLNHISASPARYSRVVHMLAAVGVDHDALVMRLTRSFQGDQLVERLRFAPSPALLSVLLRRLTMAHSEALSARIARGEALARRLAPHVEVLGAGAPHRTWWLFAIIAPAPDALCAALRAVGFDAARGSSSLIAVLPQHSDHASPSDAIRIMSAVVYLPLDPAMNDAALDRLGAQVQLHLHAHRGAPHAHPPARAELFAVRGRRNDSALPHHLGVDAAPDTHSHHERGA